MADNLYDYLNRFNLGQLGAAGNRLLQGAANTLNRYGVGQPGGLTSLRPVTGKEKINKAWGTLTEKSPEGFGYRTSEMLFNRPGTPRSGTQRQPSYEDAQGNVYDAVSGRLLYPAKSKPSPITSPTGAPPSFSGSPAAERAYQSEASRVAQLTAQDPELQRYEAARLKAVAPGATPEQVQSAEDIGMQIWAQKYGKTLAPKVKPGQAGYDVIQRTLYPGGTPVPALPAESEAMLNAIAPANEFGVRPDVTPMPGQLPSFGSATEAMFNAITGGRSLVTPMPQKSLAAVPQEQAQDLADTYKKALLSGLGNDPLGIEGIRRYGQ